MTLANGQILVRRYRIIELLGEGGFGAVYKAWDLSQERLCALKENRSASSASQNQFRREAQMLAGLQHPNLPRVTHHFELPDGGQYLVMDFVEGKDLSEVQAETGGPVQEGKVLEWGRQTCDALIYLHSQKPPIIHRDIKPANLRLTARGEVFLVDFGLAKVFAAEEATTVGARGATRGYSPPEQFAGGRTDERSDLYALGATLYNLLTAQVPVESMRRLHTDPLPAPRSLNPNISARTEQVVLRAMAPLREDRFQTAVALRRGLGEASGGSLASRATAPRGGARQRVIIVIAITALILGVCACSAVVWFLLRQGVFGPVGQAGSWTTTGLMLAWFAPIRPVARVGSGIVCAVWVGESGPPRPAWRRLG